LSILTLATKVVIKESNGRGLGVFATNTILKGEVIEECHLITVPVLRGQKIFMDYIFGWPAKAALELVLPLGYGCIYNHHENNNASWRDHPTLKAFQFYAISNIESGEEIYTNYGGEIYWDDKTVKPLI